jgi:hypothetical protein
MSLLRLRTRNEAGHWLSRRDALVRETNNRVPVIGDQDAVLRRGPGQDLGVGRTFGQNVNGAHQVDLRNAPAEAADDPAVDICVTG